MSKPRAGQSSYRYWTDPEVERLLELVGETPFVQVCREWNRWANKEGIPNRSPQSIRKKLTCMGESTVCLGRWVRLGDAARLLGKDRSTIQKWALDGLVNRYRAGSQSCILRADLRRLARERPRLFAGCDRRGLVQLLQDEDLADDILAAYPQRYQSSINGKRVLWVDRMQTFPSYAAAGRAAHVCSKAIRLGVIEGRPVCGYRFVLLGPDGRQAAA